LSDPYLIDIIERNLEIAVQCCIDICHRIISLEDAQKPQDYYESFIRLGGNWHPAVRVCPENRPPGGISQYTHT
jgi:hypothetical protein